jgi:hypothetical protein
MKKETQPNTALDAMIAEEVMGWPVIPAGEEEWFEKALERGVRPPFFAYWPEGGSALYEDDIGHKADQWSPSSNARHAADAIMKRFGKYKIQFTGPQFANSPNPGDWIVTIYRLDSEAAVLASEVDSVYELAVSKAMLKAVREEKK